MLSACFTPSQDPDSDFLACRDADDFGSEEEDNDFGEEEEEEGGSDYEEERGKKAKKAKVEKTSKRGPKRKRAAGTGSCHYTQLKMLCFYCLTEFLEGNKHKKPTKFIPFTTIYI